MKSQVNLLIDSIKRNGCLSRNDYVTVIKARGQQMDAGLVHARVKYINDHSIKFDLPINTKVGRVLVLDPIGKIEHLYMLVDKRSYVTPQAKDCKKQLGDAS